MEEFACDGVVIKEKLQGEADKLLTILTPKYGKITALARGVKNITNKNASACQLFVYADFDFAKKGTRWVLKTGVSKEVFFDMRCDAERFSLISYFADVLSHVTMENNDETNVMRLFLNTVYAVTYKKDIPLWLIKGAFEMRLMCEIGLMPDFSTCGFCGCESQIGEINIFNFETACLICKSCQGEMRKQTGAVPYSCSVRGKVVQALIYICSSDTKRFLGFNLDLSFKEEFLFICESYLIHKTERTYNTLKIYKSIVNSLNNSINTITEKNETE